MTNPGDFVAPGFGSLLAWALLAREQTAPALSAQTTALGSATEADAFPGSGHFVSLLCSDLLKTSLPLVYEIAETRMH
jgi:hypothetical protein